MKNRINKIAITASAMLIGSAMYGQIVSHNFYSYRLDNMYNSNPAYTGQGDGLNVVLNALSQNQGVSYANKNFMAGAHTKVSETQALGGRILSDTRGAFQVLKADLTYSYLLKINSDSKLNFGLSAGVLSTNLVPTRIDNYERLDQTDASLFSPYFNTTQFTSGFGARYTNRKLEISVAAPNLISTNETAISYLNGAVFYTFEANEKFKITPWLNYQNIPVLKGVGGLYVKGTYLDRIWLQAGYQTNNAISAMAGFSWENFGLGYGFTFSNKTFATVTAGFHEVVFKYKFIRTNRSATSSSNSLSEVLKQMNELANTEVTEENKESLKEQLQHLKRMLLEAEIDNSNPKQAKKVKKQLVEINEKLIILEEKFK